MCHQYGFSAAELLVAVAAMGAMVTVTRVGLGTLAPQVNLDHGTRTLAMVLTQARVQAITRGHTVEVTFGETGSSQPCVTVTDPDADPTDEILLYRELSTHITVSSDPGVVAFSPLGTVADGLMVTVSNGHYSRSIAVGFTGEVQVE
jgi:Tfp pilus assembly protein FimT